VTLGAFLQYIATWDPQVKLDIPTGWKDPMTQYRPANGQHTTDGIPHGSTSLTPHIVVSPAEKALSMYPSVLGARVSDVTRMGGLVAHAVLDFPFGRLTLSDPMPTYDLVAPDAKGVTYSLGLYVPDVDAVVAKAASAGMRVREPPTTFVSGDRYASLLDPFGVRWSVMTRVEDLSPEESAARVAQWAASLESKGKSTG
jgi:PhnB protein